MPHKGIVVDARRVAKDFHRGKRLKHVRQTEYFQNHIEPVAACARSDDEKALFFMHDTPEEAVSNANKNRKNKGLLLLNPQEEEQVIETSLNEIASRVGKKRNSELIRNLDVVTKRTSEAGFEGYQRYIMRIVVYTKLAETTWRYNEPYAVRRLKTTDNINNLAEERNPRDAKKTQKDWLADKKHRWSLELLTYLWPDAEPRLSIEMRPHNMPRPPGAKKLTREERLAIVRSYGTPPRPSKKYRDLDCGGHPLFYDLKKKPIIVSHRHSEILEDYFGKGWQTFALPPSKEKDNLQRRIDYHDAHNNNHQPNAVRPAAVARGGRNREFRPDNGGIA